MKYLYFPFLAMILLLASCGMGGPSKEKIDETLALAERAANDGDFVRAVDMCNVLTQNSDTALMSWRQYCMAGTVYARAYDHDYDTEASMAASARCMERAMAMCPDSVTSYLSTLAPADAGAVNTVLQTLNGLYVDHTRFDEHEEPDSDEHENHDE